VFFYKNTAAGQERFRAITTSYYRGADGVVMVYDITNPDSLTSLAQTWIKEIRTYASKKPQIILVGNKTDLRPKMKADEIERMELVIKEVKEQLEGEGVVDIIEVSSKSGLKVNSVFEILVDHMLVHVDRKARTGKGEKQRDVPMGVDVFAKRSDAKATGLCCNLL
jgi:GTPase SAR1 family protein